ncbi:hypothetical protein CALCODRAFT_213942 [Calocera cornea HHB12733]|uniref:Uncharacterized protein n=1 Tax=Calocera cornea HHB12733 TaxID=1353952 RepID=A0A165HB51_9BASI|nr:hypothetical protein CALCODRAFT_213942 [Calocera cornea HHB12733]
MADFTTPYTARSRPPVSSGSTASSLTSPPDSLLQDPESQSVSSPPSSPLTSIPPSEISDCEWDDNAIANGVDRSGLGFDASATTSTSSRRRSPPSSPSPSSAPSPPRRRSRPLHLKQSVMPPSSPSSSKSTNAVGQETMFLFGHPVPKATVQNRAKARVGSLLKASQIERAQVEQPQREQSTVDRSLSDQPFVKHSIVAQQASRAKQQPISSLSPPTLSGDTAADNNPTRPRITNSLKDLGKIPKKAVMVEDLFTDGIPRSGPEGAAGTVAERLSTQNRVPIVYRTPAPIYETHTGTNASPIAAAMHSGPSVLGQQASSIMSSTVYPPKEWEWSEDERQALREKLQQRNRDDEVEQRTTEPDEPPPANVLVAPVRPRNAFRRTSSSKRKREEEPEESQPVESPLKKARMDGKGELEIESPRWTGWVNYPLPGNLMFTKRSTAKARPSAAARWTNGFGAAFNGRKLTNRAIRSLPPPHSSPPISFHSWTDLSESAAYGRLRCGVQMGSRDVTGLTATALVLEGPAGPDSSWEDTTLTITMFGEEHSRG